MPPSKPRQTVICCRRTSPLKSVFPAELAELAVKYYSKSFLERPGWEPFRKVLDCLRKHCPAANPVIVRTSWMPSTILGECCRKKSRFVVRLNNHMQLDQAVETLLHEWAHALAWNFTLDKLSRKPGVTPEAFDAASHAEVWGVAYSRVWRAYSAGPETTAF